MDLQYLKDNAARHAYELRKFFPEGESLIGHYVCEEQVLVLSTKKLYVFYFKGYIDYVFELLSELKISKLEKENGSFSTEISNVSFNVRFEDASRLDVFLSMIDKWSK